MPFLGPDEMLSGQPLPGWHGRFFHAQNMTFAHYEIEAGAPALHEHHHPEEEVWNVVDGEIVLSIGNEERTLRPGDVGSSRPTPRTRPVWSRRAGSWLRTTLVAGALPGGIGQRPNPLSQLNPYIFAASWNRGTGSRTPGAPIRWARCGAWPR